MTSNYKVRAVQCAYQADDETIYQALRRATDPLTETWAKLEKANRIAIKFNMDKHPDRWVFYEGHLQQLVSENVARAVLRLLRERTTAELICVDVSYYKMYNGTTIEQSATLLPLLKEFDITFVDGTQPPYKKVDVPGGGQMFKHYILPQDAVEADEFVCVGKMKNHAFMGITLSLKNLFGLMPGEPEWHTRHYFHHLVRMPYMLADLGRIFNPTLNIIDALVSQAGREWGTGQEDGPARVTNTLIAGNHTIATDACSAHLMGHDPQSDWLTPPFHRDRNALLVAAEAGFGTVNLDEIDFQAEVAAPLGEFYAALTDPMETVISWRKTTCEQALFYVENRQALIDKYAGEYILLQEGEVRWHNPVSDLKQSRRKLAGDKPEQAMWLKDVDPAEAEDEKFAVYNHALKDLREKEAAGLLGQS